jgi:ABC-type branched-subunit amino acid transport system substrate-binding protein
MKKALPVVIIVLLIAGAAGILFFNAKKAEQASVAASISRSGKPAIKIGVVTPMSGNIGAIGKELVSVISRKVEELNADPKNRFEYKFIFEDSQFDPKVTHLAAMKLINTDHVDAIITVAALSARVVEPLCKRYHLPQLALASEDAALGEWTFTYFATAEDTAYLAAQSMKAFGYKKFVFMGQRQAAILLYARGMKKAADGLGLDDAGELFWNADDPKDFRGYLLKARELHPDAIVYGPTPPDPDILMTQLRQLDIQTPVIALESLDLLVDRTLANGKWVSGPPPLTQEFRDKMKACGMVANLPYDPYAYDIPGILVQAVEHASAGGQRPTGIAIRKSLSAMGTVQTTFGEVQQENHIFHPAPVLVYYENGVGRQVSLQELKRLKGVK